MGILAGGILTLGLLAYIFWPERLVFTQKAKTRADYLLERRDVVYENLRDLNFEYKAGKYPEEDYISQRTALEDEASRILAELDTLSR